MVVRKLKLRVYVLVGRVSATALHRFCEEERRPDPKKQTNERPDPQRVASPAASIARAHRRPDRIRSGVAPIDLPQTASHGRRGGQPADGVAGDGGNDEEDELPDRQGARGPLCSSSAERVFAREHFGGCGQRRAAAVWP